MAEGPTCLYRYGESCVFEAEDVEQALADGWVDAPVLAAPEPSGEPEEQPTEPAIEDPTDVGPIEDPTDNFGDDAR